MKTVQLMSNFVFLVVFVSTGKSYKKLMAKFLMLSAPHNSGLIGEPSGGGGGRVNSTRKNASQSPNYLKLNFPGT